MIDGLVDDGALALVELPPEPVAPPPDPDSSRARCRPTRRRRRQTLSGSGRRPRLRDPVLLEGVTGSGKTEVYFEAVAAALKANRQTLILMPEIALTSQFLDRFAERFGVQAGRMAFGRHAAPARASVGRLCERRGAASWSARARLCSCRSPTSA